jgi:glucose/arabinose dehydrogenase
VRVLLLSLAVLTLVPSAVAHATNVVPTGFDDRNVANVGGVMDITFTPDGRMLVLRRAGLLNIRREDGILVKGTALDLRSKVCSTLDRGLQSIAVDPSFGTNHYIYIYYTSNKNGNCSDNTYPNGPVNRLSRFVLADNNTVDPLSEAVLIDNIPSMNFHQGGDTGFGKDGYLYVTVGDGDCDYAGDSGCGNLNDVARDTNTLLGKVLRLTAPDGGIPPDNPYTGSNSARCNLTSDTDAGKFCQETYASGLRNPWRFAFDPNATGTRFFINDVGEGTWEEIDIGQSGADYGWNVREGPCANGSRTDCGPPPPNMTNPIYYYGHEAGCGAITGGAFVPPGVWRREDAGAYLYADYNCGKIFELVPSAGGDLTASEILSGMGPSSISDMTFGPYLGGQALYYSSWGSHEIRRLAYIGTNPRPRSAPVLRVPLVPAYGVCTAFNDIHGAPLSLNSCAPPVQVSDYVTVGTSDANDRRTKSTGSVTLKVALGNPSTVADEADVRMWASLTDIRNKASLSDYTGELELRFTVRLTDRANGTSGADPATTEDFPVAVTVPCAATDSTAIGATCSAATTADAMTPGAVTESKRSIWQLDKVQVFDGGADGLVSTSGNTLFADQGVFVP